MVIETTLSGTSHPRYVASHPGEATPPSVRSHAFPYPISLPPVPSSRKTAEPYIPPSSTVERAGKGRGKTGISGVENGILTISERSMRTALKCRDRKRCPCRQTCPFLEISSDGSGLKYRGIQGSPETQRIRPPIFTIEAASYLKMGFSCCHSKCLC